MKKYLVVRYGSEYIMTFDEMVEMFGVSPKTLKTLIANKMYVRDCRIYELEEKPEKEVKIKERPTKKELDERLELPVYNLLKNGVTANEIKKRLNISQPTLYKVIRSLKKQGKIHGLRCSVEL